MPLANPEPTLEPALFALLAVLLNAFIRLCIADFALSPIAFNPLSTRLTDAFMLSRDFFVDFAFFAIDFMLEFTAFNAAAISASPTALTIAPTPNAITPAAATTSPAPNATAPAAAKIVPAANTIMLAPRDAIAIAACCPYITIIGSCVASNVIPAAASNTPAPTNNSAAPNAIKPIAPAVNAVPSAAAPTARSAITATKPTITPMARGPALARLIAENASNAKPAAIKTTAAPSTTNAVATLINCPDIGARVLSITVMPKPNAAIAAMSPNITPIASGPACASLIAENAKIANPADMIKTAALSIKNALAAAIT